MADVLIADVRQASASFSLLALCEKWLMADVLIADISAKQNFSFSLPALCDKKPPSLFVLLAHLSPLSAALHN